MAVKRFTIELDDTPDTENRTSSPHSLIGKERLLPSVGATETPEQQLDYQQQEQVQKEITNRVETIGRTPADLVVTFINRTEFMATALTFLSFVIFVGNLKQVSDFKWPLLTSAIINAVWFGIIGGRRLIAWLAMKQKKHGT
jgi:hypothetical protein